MDKKVIAVLSAGTIKNKNGRWRSTGIDERNKQWGAPGGYLRVLAGSYLYKKNSSQFIIACGGKGWDVKDDYTHPNLSKILKDELVELGVPIEKIIEENNSNTTYEQLQGLADIIEKRKFKNLVIVSSRYHLPRIKSMIKMDQKLNKILAQPLIELVEAEKVILKNDNTRWKKIIDDSYQSKRMREIINLEKQGIKDIWEGKYKFR